MKKLKIFLLAVFSILFVGCGGSCCEDGTLPSTSSPKQPAKDVLGVCTRGTNITVIVTETQTISVVNYGNNGITGVISGGSLETPLELDLDENLTVEAGTYAFYLDYKDKTNRCATESKVDECTECLENDCSNGNCILDEPEITSTGTTESHSYVYRICDSEQLTMTVLITPFSTP